jgi:hypothetical protein
MLNSCDFTFCDDVPIYVAAVTASVGNFVVWPAGCAYVWMPTPGVVEHYAPHIADSDTERRFRLAMLDGIDR